LPTSYNYAILLAKVNGLDLEKITQEGQKMDSEKYAFFKKIFDSIKILMAVRSSLKDGMQAAVNIAVELGIKRICIFLRDQEVPDKMVLLCGYPKDGHGLQNKFFLKDHEGLKEIMTRKKMLVVKNPGNHRSACTKEFCQTYGINANLFIRLEVDGNPIGAIVIDAVGQKREFNKHDIKLAKEIALLATKKFHNRQRMEREITQANMWLMAAEIAHEFRNPLFTITGFLPIIRKRVDNGGDEKLKQYLKAITEEANRLTLLLNETTKLLKQDKPKPEKQNLNKLAEELLLERKKQGRENIEFILEKGEKLPPVYMDQEQIKIALLQIIKNAEDAIGENKEKITLTTYKKTAPFVCLAITNTGSHIPKEEVEKIFTPFYTRKSKSTSLGLGLAITKEIIQNHGGYIDVRSKKEPPETSFHCCLPIKVPAVIKKNK